MRRRTGSGLWTRNFTILTLGTVVSMLGNAISGFAVSLMALDFTGSVFLMVLVNVVYNLPRVLLPALAGPYLDRFSRVRAIYGLDFLSAAIYALLAGLLFTGWFRYWLMLLAAPVLGAIDSVYATAYDSLFPTLSSKENLPKAYSVSSLITPLASAMVPVAAYLYGRMGLAPMFAINAASFLAAALFETRIRVREEHLDRPREAVRLRGYVEDLVQGARYIRAERGLQAIAGYYTLNALLGACSVLTLPYFKATPGLGVQWYTYVAGCAVLGRLVGGLAQYRFRVPLGRRFAAALCVYTLGSVLDGLCLFTPLPAMMALSFLTGAGYVTSYNIRMSATQAYVPNELRGRFNGAFAMFTTLGGVVGQLALGALGDVFNGRLLIAACMGLNGVAGLWLLLRNRRAVRLVYDEGKTARA